MTSDELREQFLDGAGLRGWRVDQEFFPNLVEESIFPARKNIFKALEVISPADVRYLILGQDPYPGRDANGDPDATGIAFAVDQNRVGAIPPSLRRIMNNIYPNGQGPTDLEDWRENNQILLLNAALTVPENSAGAHMNLWKDFTKSIIRQVKRENPAVELVAWGRPAMDIFCDALDLFTWSYHPVSRTGGARSFSNFWVLTPVGQTLAAGNVAH